MEGISQINTIQDLKRKLAQLENDAGQVIHLLIGNDSDLTSVTNAVVEDTKDDARCPDEGTKWIVQWSSEGEYYDSEKMMNLIGAVAGYHLTKTVQLRLPFKHGFLAKMAKTVFGSGDIWLGSLVIGELELCGDFISSEDAEKDLIDFFGEICNWRGEIVQSMDLQTRCTMNPILLSRLAELFPKLHLETLIVTFKDSPDCDASDQNYIDHLTHAHELLQNGLESNVWLHRLGIWVDSADSSPLNKLLSKLFDEKLEFRLALNRDGRRYTVSMPSHLDTWLEILARYTFDDGHDDSVDYIYYYLRRNTWMFTADTCLVKENKCLKDELKACRKRHRNEMGAKEQEIQQKDQEIQQLKNREIQHKDEENQSLRAALEAKEKRHKADLEEIQQLKAQLQSSNSRKESEPTLQTKQLTHVKMRAVSWRPGLRRLRPCNKCSHHLAGEQESLKSSLPPNLR